MHPLSHPDLVETPSPCTLLTILDPTYVDPNSSQGIYAGFQMYNSDLADSAVGDTTEPEAYSFNYDYDYDI